MSGKAAGKKDKRNAAAMAAVTEAPGSETEQGPESKRPRGKASKKEEPEETEIISEEEAATETAEETKTAEKRPRGRPKGTAKKAAPKADTGVVNSDEKRPRGRPKGTGEKTKVVQVQKTGAKRGRGRPPKKNKAEAAGDSEEEN